MDPCKHVWKPVPGAVYALRRCETCKVLARTANGNVKPLVCQTCKGPAMHARLGSFYCDKDLIRPGNLKTLAEMSEEQIRALEKQYGVPVKRTKPD